MNSIPTFIWIFYVVVPVIGFCGTVLTVYILKNKSKEQ